MTRRGATVRKQWPRLSVRLPSWQIDWSFLRPLSVVVSVAVALSVVVFGVRWVTPTDIRWTIAGELLFQDRQQIMDVLASHVDEDTTYWRLSLSEIETDLRQLPWIDQVSLERQWPDQVQVTLVEQTPLAFWNDHAFINSRGEVFGPSQLTFDLPRLSGPDGRAEDVMANYLRFSQMFSAMGYRIQALTLAQRGSWEVTLDNGVQVKLGQRNILQRARRVARVLAETKDGGRANDIATLDARYQYGVAVAWKSGDSA